MCPNNLRNSILVALLCSLNGCAAIVPYVTPDAQGRGQAPVDRPVRAMSSGVVETAVIAVPKKKDKVTRRLEKLTKNLDYKDPVVRTHAAFWLGEMREAARPAIPALTSTLLKDDSRWVRRASAKALGKIGTSDAVRPLTLALKDRDKWVAHSAANALKTFKSREARVALANYKGI
ncbi:MAG: HEAT repeat domain-containing protein [Deltaproteobacteria bacterium]|nr:HEAT repeat domain-containing protein [Deltaproteobacteria bacterium]